MEPELSKVREVKFDKFTSDIIDAGFLNEDSIMLWPMDQFDQCIIGADTEGRAVYSEQLIIKSFMKDGMSYEEAAEFVEYNTIRAIEHIPHGQRPVIIRVQRKRTS